ncbi:MAG: hypothetical protein ABJH28_09245 [Paraglaciecola sp.]|uniref:hypothetical protein n=1 Tax=Paraglaciecola sp. TaxID=1920173 RepID=UPI0032631AF1
MLLTCIIFVSANAVAGSCNTTSCTSTIKRIYPYGPHAQVRIELDDVNLSTLDCTAKEGNFLTLTKGDDQLLFSEVYSLLLTAAAKDDEVIFRIRNGSSSCELLYVMYYP